MCQATAHPSQLGLGGGRAVGHRRVGGRRNSRHNTVDPRLDAKVSQEDMVRTTIQNFDAPIQKGDLPDATQHYVRHNP